MDSTSISKISKECNDCNLLPICIGGCPKAKAIGKKDCCYPKYWLKEYIKSFVSLKKKANNTDEPKFV